MLIDHYGLKLDPKGLEWIPLFCFQANRIIFYGFNLIDHEKPIDVFAHNGVHFLLRAAFYTQ